MTSESGPAWRPSTRSPKKREKRRQQIVILSGVLVLLILLVGWLLWKPAVPRFLLVSVASPVPKQLDSDNLPDLTAQANQKLITSLFERLTETNSELVIPAAELCAQTTLPPVLSPCSGENLLLYLDARAIAVAGSGSDSDNVNLQLSLDGQDKSVAFSDILDLLKALRPENALLLLDIDTAPPGFATGTLAVDIVSIIQKQLQAKKIEGLTVIGACRTGQRSWEFPEAAEPQESGEAGSDAGDDKTTPADARLPRYRTTAFAHFFAEAVRTGNAATVELLFQYLKTQSADSARKHFGVTQTVWIYPSRTGKEERVTPLFDRLNSPRSLMAKAVQASGEALTAGGQGEQKDAVQPSDAADTENTENTADTDNTDNTDNTENTENTDNTQGDSRKPKSPPKTRRGRLAAFEQQLSDFAAADGRVKLHDTWRETQSIIAFAQYALRFPDSSVNGLLEKTISARIRTLKAQRDEASPASGGSDPDQTQGWEQIVTSLPIFGRDFNAKQDELFEYNRQTKEVVLSDIVRKNNGVSNNEARRRFSEWLLRELEQDLRPSGEALTSQSLAAIQEKITVLNGVFASLNGKVALPDSVQVLHRLLQGFDQIAVNDLSEVNRFLFAVVRLARTRQQVLELTVDAQRGNLPISDAMFEPTRERLTKSVLPQLLAAEEWLSSQVAGVHGGQLAEECLNRADEVLTEIRKLQAEQRKRDVVSIELRSQLPSLMEFLSVRMERQGLTEEELKELSETALKTEIDQIVVRESQWGSGFTRELMKAVEVVNRDYRTNSVNVTTDLNQIERIGQTVREMIAANAPDDQFLAHRLPREYRNSINISAEPSAPPSDDSVRDNKRRFTGIWTSYWSLRTLRTVKSLSFPDEDDSADSRLLFQEWSQLVNALLEERSQASGTGTQTEPRTEGISKTSGSAVARARLAATLKEAWRSFAERQTSALNSSVRLVDSRKVQGMLRMPVTVKQLTEVPVLSSPQEAQLTLSKPEGASRIYLKRVTDDASVLVNGQRMVPDTDPVSGNADWYFSDLAEAESGIRIDVRVSGVINAQLPLLAVFASSDRNPLAVHRSTVSPSTATDWEIQMAYATPGASDFTVNKEGADASSVVKLRRFDLIPSTIGDEGKDVPVALKVMLRRLTGIASKAKVRMYVLTSDQLDPSYVPGPAETPQSEWNVEFTDPTNEIVLPFTPPAAAPVPGAAPAPPGSRPKELSVNSGMLFHIQSEGVTPPTDKWIRLFPRLMDPREYTDAVATFDRSKNLLTVKLEVKKAWRQTAFRGRKIPYLLTFGGSLNRCKPDGVIQGVSTPGSSPDPIEIRFGDVGNLSDLLKMDRRSMMPEFGLSLADSLHVGIPHAFRWRLEGATPQRLDQATDEQVPQPRIEFTPIVPKEAAQPSVLPTGELVLGSNWETIPLAAAFHFHGGGFAAGTQQWQLKVMLRKVGDGSGPTRIQNFFLRSPYDTSVTAAASENNDWNFSTTSKLYSIPNVNPVEFGFRRNQDSSCGKYELSAALENRNDSNQVAEVQTVSFIVDHTPPTIDDLDDPQNGTPDVVPHGQDTLKVRFNTTDDHSGVKQVKVWLGDADAGEVAPLDGLPGNDGKFMHTIRADDFPEVEAKVGEKNSVTATLHIEVMNFAGLVKPAIKKIRFTREALPKPKEKMEPVAEFGHIKVTMPMRYSSPWVVTVTGPTGPPVEQEGAKKEFEFRGLAVGKYKVEWKIKTDGSRSGSGSATVTKDNTATVIAP